MVESAYPLDIKGSVLVEGRGLLLNVRFEDSFSPSYNFYFIFWDESYSRFLCIRTNSSSVRYRYEESRWKLQQDTISEQVARSPFFALDTATGLLPRFRPNSQILCRPNNVLRRLCCFWSFRHQIWGQMIQVINIFFFFILNHTVSSALTCRVFCAVERRSCINTCRHIDPAAVNLKKVLRPGSDVELFMSRTNFIEESRWKLRRLNQLGTSVSIWNGSAVLFA